MTQALIHIAERRTRIRAALTDALGDDLAFRIESVDSLVALRRAMRSAPPDLIIAPWSEGSETAIAARETCAPRSALGLPPPLLALTPEVTGAKIALARRAHAVDLIPCAPLDAEALANRVLFVVGGADALARRHGRDRSFDEALLRLPALRRRFAA